jgi:antibiotic biosynthesis monooxygenase (ABM) superfamily enzyme
MALLVLALVLTIITGANYFGRPITKRIWLVLFVLSVLALVIDLLEYRGAGL